MAGQNRRGQELQVLYQELRGKVLRPVYLLYGDEDFQISQGLEAIKGKALAGIPTDFNYDQYYAKEVDAGRVIGSANMLPMMSPRRVVILRDTNEFRDADLKQLVTYVENPCPSTVLILTGRALGKKRKLLAGVRKNGLAIQFRHLYERELRPWIRGEFSRQGKTIGEDGVHFMISMVGENLRELHSEILKVAIYVGPKERITMEDLHEVISDISLETVFAFNNAVGKKQAGIALQQLNRMLELDPKASAFSILAMLHRHFRQLYRTRRLMDQGLGLVDIMQELGIQERMRWKAEKELFPQVRQRTESELRRALSLLYEVNLSLRTQRAPNNFVLDAFVLRLCR